MLASPWCGPVNIGPEEMVSINQLAEIVMKIAGKRLHIVHVEGPQGVRGRNSDNRLIVRKLNWKPALSLEQGLVPTYEWIAEQRLVE